MPRITGRAIDVTRDTRPQTDQQSGEIRNVTTITVHVLDGREVVPVRLARDFTEPTPEPGTDVDLYVLASAWTRRNGGAGLTFTAIRTFDPASLSALASA